MTDPRTVPVRFTNLKQMARSPAHYLHNLQQEREDTPAFKLGRATHRLALEGILPVIYDGRRAGKEWEAFAAGQQCPMEDILNVRESEQVCAIAGAVRRHPEAVRLLRGTIEQKLQWQLGGRDCQGTPDVVAHGHIADLKTCRDAHPDRLMWQALRLNYHAQLAWYREGVRLSGAGTPSEAYIVAVESTPPHPVVVLRVTEPMLERGARLCRLWFEQLLVCEESGVWPGYSEAIVDWNDTEGDGVPLLIDGEEVAA